MYSNGTYDGTIGLVQRNVVDTTLTFSPYDSIDNEPGVFAPSPLIAFSPHVYSARIRGGNSFKLNVLYLYHNHDTITWIYYMVTLTLCSCICVLFHYKRKQKRLKLKKAKKMVKCFLNQWWNYFCATIDMAASEISDKLSISVVWTFIVLGLFYGIHMIFMGTFSADLAANTPDRWITRVSDWLYDDTFQNFKPTITTNMHMFRILSKVTDGTEAKLLYERAKSSNSIIEIEGQPMSYLSKFRKLFREVSAHERAVIEDSSIMSIMITAGACHIMPELAVNFVQSRDYLQSSPLVMLISHATNKEVVKLFTYRTRNSNEFATIDGFLKHKLGKVMEAQGFSRNIKGYHCADLFLGIAQRDNEGGWDPLPIEFLQTFLTCCSVIVPTALIALWYECLTWEFLHGRELDI